LFISSKLANFQIIKLFEISKKIKVKDYLLSNKTLVSNNRILQRADKSDEMKLMKLSLLQFNINNAIIEKQIYPQHGNQENFVHARESIDLIFDRFSIFKNILLYL
jgi:hypothetical protein